MSSTLHGPEYSGNVGIPLCVDLDGTLVKADLLVEGILSMLSNTNMALKLPAVLTFNRALLKKNVASFVEVLSEHLPYNEKLVAYLRAEKLRGRRLVLATAADRKTAQAIAEHLGLFDDIIASDGTNNLKGETKANELIARFGQKGFDYVGNSFSDLEVWKHANAIIVVNASGRTLRRARQLGEVVREFAADTSVAQAAIRAIRPHQWAKNILVFVPLLTSRSFDDVSAVLEGLLIFASFCATASSIYLINDMLDLAADRRHPRKRNRPFANGDLPISVGLLLAALLFVFGASTALASGALLLVLLYALLSLSYSLDLKRYPLVDVFILASLYTLRIVTGGVATGHSVTMWLLAFSGFTFLSLALVKRVGEVYASTEATGSQLGRRGYSAEDYPVLMAFGVASAFASSVVLALFIGTSAAFEPYVSPETLYALVPLVLFWQMRLWLSTARGNMHDDPIVYASKDWVSWTVAALVVAIVFLASSVQPLLWFQEGS